MLSTSSKPSIRLRKDRACYGSSASVYINFDGSEVCEESINGVLLFRPYLFLVKFPIIIQRLFFNYAFVVWVRWNYALLRFLRQFWRMTSRVTNYGIIIDACVDANKPLLTTADIEILCGYDVVTNHLMSHWGLVRNYRVCELSRLSRDVIVGVMSLALIDLLLFFNVSVLFCVNSKKPRLSLTLTFSLIDNYLERINGAGSGFNKCFLCVELNIKQSLIDILLRAAFLRLS